MPESVMFTHAQQNQKIFFHSTQAVLPVKLKTGEIKLIKWGRRGQEEGSLPLGGWARLSQLQDLNHSHWAAYFPKPVQILIDRFMEKDFEGRMHWYEVTKGKCLQGLLAHIDNEYRVYIVTIDPEHPTNMHYRWPKILNLPD